MNGGARVAQVFKNHGVPFVFTLCGGHISPILVESKKLGIRIVDVRHEVNAVFAADAVGRLTGIPGVACVTAGPGVANTITAVKNAQMAQSPLVLIGGATATMLRGRGSLQDIDQMALIRPHVKWAARPNRLKDVVPALERAFQVAKEGVPGPVFVELAIDLLYDESLVREWTAKQTDKKDKNVADHALSLYVRGHLKYVFAQSAEPEFAVGTFDAPAPPAEKYTSKAAEWLREAARPVLVIGSQAMLHPGRANELVEAVEALGIPTFCSGMARGLLGKGHALQLRHKRSAALKQSDLVILAGVPCDFRLDYGSHVARTKVISANLSKDDLFKNLRLMRKPELPVHHDPHAFLVALAGAAGAPPQREGWWETLRSRNAARDEEILEMGNEDVSHMNPLAFCQHIETTLSDNSILIGDGGDFVATAAYTVSPRSPYSWLDPGVFGTLGVGAGFAIGAKLVRPDADVWLLYGDGAAGFSMMEFDTMARHNLPIIAVVGNDAGWTQIQRDQVPILGDDVGTTLTHMDYHDVAKACGGKGVKISAINRAATGLEKALTLSREGHPVCVNAIIGKTKFREGSISM
jgi:acetolactate synthase-like protein